MARQETGEGIAKGKRRENKEAVISNPKQEIELSAGELAAELETVAPARQGDGIADLVVVLVRILRARYRISNAGITADNQVGRSGSEAKRGLVLKA